MATAENTTDVTECQTDAKKDICDIAAKKECSTTSEANGKQENGTEHVPEKVQSPEKLSPSKAKASISVNSPAKSEEKDEKNGTCKEVPEKNGGNKPESQEKDDKKETTTEKNAAQEKTVATPEKNGSPSKGHLKKPLEQLDSVEDGPETKRARRSMEEKCDKTSEGSNCEAVKEENGAAVASN